MQVIRHSNSANTFFAHNSIIDYSTTRIDESLVGVSKWTEDARMLVSLHSTHDDTVIIVGERGTGKKLIARLIHRNSARRRGPFVSLSLGSITEDVARSSLFGSNENETKDSFTSDKGLLEQAQGGTLYISGISAISRDFIDEILRRSLNNRERAVRILFGWCVRTADSHESDELRYKGFDCERIEIPPLRWRKDDIEALADHFIKQYCEQSGREQRKISPEAMDALCHYDWPRNVTELKTLASQMVKQLDAPPIDVRNLPTYLAGPSRTGNTLPSAGLDLDDEVKRVEVDLICAALRQCHGLQNRAAQLLRVKPTTLFMKIKRYGIDVGVFR